VCASPTTCSPRPPRYAAARPRRSTTRWPAIASTPPLRRCDVFEMYWADLSRLGGGATRILTELFTLLFHLSKLGPTPSRWPPWRRRPAPCCVGLHVCTAGATGCSRACSRLLFLQLLVCAIVLVPVALMVGRERTTVSGRCGRGGRGPGGGLRLHAASRVDRGLSGPAWCVRPCWPGSQSAAQAWRPGPCCSACCSCCCGPTAPFSVIAKSGFARSMAWACS
jgi:hypothetical protein